MRNAIASILAAATLAGLAGCESNAVPSASSMLGYQVDTIRDRSVWLTREGVLIHSTAISRADHRRRAAGIGAISRL